MSVPTRLLTTRLLLLAVLAASLIAATMMAMGQASAMPILGQYPTGNIVVEYEFDADDLATNIVIDNVNVGLKVEGEWPQQRIVHDDGDGDGEIHLFDVEQDTAMTLSGDRGGRIRVEDETRATLRSAATGAVFLWEPRFSGEVTCVEGGTGRDPLEDCEVIQVHQVYSGNISGPAGTGSCGSLQQEYSFIIHKLEEAGYVVSPGSATSAGELKVSNDRCAAAIYGVMPGDNVTIDLANQSGWITAIFDEAEALFGGRTQVRDSHDRYANAEFAFTGMLRDGTRISGTAQGDFTVREDSAQGEVAGEVLVAGTDEPIPFRGDLRLENITPTREGGVSAQGTLRVMVGMGQKDAGG